MSYEVLIPLDGSEASRWVVSKARSILSRRGVEATVFHVEGPRGGDKGTLAALARTVQEMNEWGVATRGVLGRGEPAPTILERAREGGADLILLSSHCRPGSDITFFGKVTRALLQESPAPMLILRPYFRPNGQLSPACSSDPLPLRTILVPLDGSRVAERILPETLRLARVLGVRICLYSTLETGATDSDSLSPRTPDFLTSWKDRGEAMGIEMIVSHRPGSPLITCSRYSIGRTSAWCPSPRRSGIELPTPPTTSSPEPY